MLRSHSTAQQVSDKDAEENPPRVTYKYTHFKFWVLILKVENTVFETRLIWEELVANFVSEEAKQSLRPHGPHWRSGASASRCAPPRLAVQSKKSSKKSSQQLLISFVEKILNLAKVSRSSWRTLQKVRNSLVMLNTVSLRNRRSYHPRTFPSWFVTIVISRHTIVRTVHQ